MTQTPSETPNDPITREQFLEEWDTISRAARDRLTGTPSLMTLLDLSREDLDVIYRNGHQAFMAEDYAHAENLFFSLFLWDFKNPDYQTALAGACEAQEKFDMALSLYMLALTARDRDPELLFRVGKCLMGLGRKDEARILFEIAGENAEISGDRPVAQAAARHKSRQMLSLLTH